MTILITGVNGFVGQELFRSLNDNYNVIGIFNESKKLYDNCHKVDLLKQEEINDFCDNKLTEQIDTIVHLSSKTAMANNAEDVSLLITNAALAKNVAVMAKKINAKHFINLSSSAVYSNSDGIYNESSITDPTENSDCIYGLSKFNSEVLINNFLLKTKTIITHLRVGMVYGDGIDKSRLIPVLEKEILENNTATLFGNGERIFNIIQVKTLIKYISFFIKYPANDIINVAEENISLLHLAERIILKKGNKQTKIILKEHGNKNKFILDTKKLQTILRNAEF